MADKPQTVEEYISSKPRAVQQRLQELRSCLLIADPNAQETLKWGKPALINDGILFVYAGFNKHISLHPTPSVIATYHHALQNYKLSQNTIQFPLDNPLPQALVIELAKWRVHEKNELGIGWK